MKLIYIDKESLIPIYQQIVESVEDAIISKRLFRNDRLPSVNKVCLEHKVSRDTVFLAYEKLKQKGIIKSIPAKGYYVKREEFSYDKNYFVLFDELNSFKEDLLTGFLKPFNNKAQVDIYFHHFNFGVFRKQIMDNIGNYSKYIIMPGNLEGVEEVIAKLPEKDVYIIDQMRDSLRQYSGIYQNFVTDIYNSFESSRHIIEKYNHYILIFPGNKEPVDMIEGFKKYCERFEKRYSIISSTKDFTLEKGQLFLIPDDRQLVETVDKYKLKDLKLGKDIGIISYNETPLKKVVADGITTLSTDFSEMGKRLSEMVIKNEKIQIENPATLIIRRSI
jgi:DNA-binding transcriptional regulator YhcF (GntR family)